MSEIFKRYLSESQYKYEGNFLKSEGKLERRFDANMQKIWKILIHIPKNFKRNSALISSFEANMKKIDLKRKKFREN